MNSRAGTSARISICDSQALTQISAISGICTGKVIAFQTEVMDSGQKVLQAIVKDRSKMLRINVRKLVDPVTLRLASAEMHKRPKGISWHGYYNYAAKRMKNAVINYVVEAGSGGQFGNRLRALAIIQKEFWYRRDSSGLFVLREQQLVPGRVLAVFPDGVAVDVFGVQIAVSNQYIMPRDKLFNGNIVLVRLAKVVRKEPAKAGERPQIDVLASIRQIQN